MAFLEDAKLLAHSFHQGRSAVPYLLRKAEEKLICVLVIVWRGTLSQCMWLCSHCCL